MRTRFEIDGKHVFAFYVPEASRGDKPIYLQQLLQPVGETLFEVKEALRQRFAQAAEQATPQATGEVTGEVRRLLSVMAREMKRTEIQDALGLKHEDHFRDAYLLAALEASVIEMTVLDKPRNSKQRYRLTEREYGVLGKGKA
ncbi:MAG: hypothetical protein L0H29_11540 [Sinobacteraceae bacterium]|nr:hypothetical protein [Nevskiaceae bacterium]